MRLDLVQLLSWCCIQYFSFATSLPTLKLMDRDTLSISGFSARYIRSIVNSCLSACFVGFAFVFVVAAIACLLFLSTSPFDLQYLLEVDLESAFPDLIHPITPPLRSYRSKGAKRFIAQGAYTGSTAAAQAGLVADPGPYAQFVRFGRTNIASEELA